METITLTYLQFPLRIIIINLKIQWKAVCRFFSTVSSIIVSIPDSHTDTCLKLLSCPTLNSGKKLNQSNFLPDREGVSQ